MGTPNRPAVALTDIDTFLLLEHTHDATRKVILALLLQTGMTVHELASLHVRDLDLDKGIIILPPQKRKGRGRSVPMTEDLNGLLTAHVREHRLAGTRAVLFTRESSRMTERRIQQIVEESTKKILGKAASPRTLRTSYILNELKRGTPVAAIEERCGLASLAPYLYLYHTSKKP